MLFTSYEFLLLFFPASVFAYFLLGHGVWARAAVLAVASAIFYATWNWHFIALLLGSICVNYLLGAALQRSLLAGRPRRANLPTTVGIALNLGILGLFKY